MRYMCETISDQQHRRNALDLFQMTNTRSKPNTKEFNVILELIKIFMGLDFPLNLNNCQVFQASVDFDHIPTNKIRIYHKNLLIDYIMVNISTKNSYFIEVREDESSGPI